jgi:hypothetical protein
VDTPYQFRFTGTKAAMVNLNMGQVLIGIDGQTTVDTIGPLPTVAYFTELGLYMSAGKTIETPSFKVLPNGHGEAPTPAPESNDGTIATTAFVHTALAAGAGAAALARGRGPHRPQSLGAAKARIVHDVDFIWDGKRLAVFVDGDRVGFVRLDKE